MTVGLRLRGTPTEIDNILVTLRGCPNLSIYSVSPFYKDRGNTVYGRVYVDVAYDKGEEE